MAEMPCERHAVARVLCPCHARTHTHLLLHVSTCIRREPMMEPDLTALSIAEAGPLVARRDLSPVELTEAYLARIERLNPLFNAYVTVTAEAARAAEDEIAHGLYRGPLHGMPVALKDLYATRGV